jgi:hypothetical protein
MVTPIIQKKVIQIPKFPTLTYSLKWEETGIIKKVHESN